MKMPVVIVLCLVFALAGFFGGRLSGPEAPADAQGPSKSSGATTTGARGGDGEGKGEKDKSANAKGERRSGSGNSNSNSNSVAESFRQYFASLKDQTLVLPDGEEREAVAADLARLSQLMGSISRADTADVAELKEVLTTLEEPVDEEADALKTLLLPALLGREVELRGAAALDEMVEKNAEEEDDIFSDALPAMAYTLAKQNAAEADAWYKTFMARPDAEEFSIDTDELKALIEKGKKAGK